MEQEGLNQLTQRTHTRMGTTEDATHVEMGKHTSAHRTSLRDDNKPQTTRNAKTQKTSQTQCGHLSFFGMKLSGRFSKLAGNHTLNEETRPTRNSQSTQRTQRRTETRDDTTHTETRGNTRFDVLSDFY